MAPPPYDRAAGMPRQRGLIISESARLLATVVATWCALLATASLAQDPSAPRAPDTIEARVRACTPCHGEQGQGTDNDYFPRLAGKPAGYLENQLVAFRDGRRRYAPMNYLLEYQTDAYLQKDRRVFFCVAPAARSRRR